MWLHKGGVSRACRVMCVMGVRGAEGVGGSLVRKGLGAVARSLEVTGSHEKVLSCEWGKWAAEALL